MKQYGKWLTFAMIGLVCAVLGSGVWASGLSTGPAAVAETNEKLSGISAEEHRIIGELFEMSALIEWMNTEIIRLNHEIENLNEDIAKKQQLIDKEAAAYANVKKNMSEVLKRQQRAGAASTVEIILSARDLKDLIHRINVLRDVSRSTVNLMNTIEATQARLTQEQLALKAMLGNRQEQQRTITAAYERQRSARVERERYLNSLQADKAYYEGYLLTMEKRWKSIKPVFSDTVRSFNRIIQAGGLPPDTVVVSYSLFYAKGRIDESKLNAVLAARNDLPRLQFDLTKGQVALNFPDYDISLKGKFLRRDAHTIQYEVTGGTFYGFPLSADALKDLFSAGDLIFDLGTMIGNHGINRIDVQDGFIELLITGRP